MAKKEQKCNVTLPFKLHIKEIVISPKYKDGSRINQLFEWKYCNPDRKNQYGDVEGFHSYSTVINVEEIDNIKKSFPGLTYFYIYALLIARVMTKDQGFYQPTDDSIFDNFSIDPKLRNYGGDSNSGRWKVSRKVVKKDSLDWDIKIDRGIRNFFINGLATFDCEIVKFR